jgi:5'-nucleotidase
MKRTRIAALLGLVLMLGLAPAAAARPPDEKATRAATTEVQLLALNDFHGQLETVNPVSSSGGRIGSLTDTNPDPTVTTNECLEATCVPAGGAEYLATHVRNLRADNPNTLFLSAGDLIGATPLLSAAFHDEPTIEAFNLMDLDFNGVGNHEFDEGVDELLRMQSGGCHPEDGCQDGDGFAGAEFGFLAANVVYKDGGDTIFPPYAIKEFQGVKIGIVGMTLEGTPLIVSPAGIATVDFLDEAASVNALVPVLKEQGVETIVVLLHEGGERRGVSGNGAGNVGAVNTCTNVGGTVPNIVAAMDDEIDVVITGHTNWAINCPDLYGKVVTGAASQGRLVTDIDLTISRATKEPIEVSINNQIVSRDVTRASDITALMAKYQTLVAPVAARVIGSTTAAMDRGVLTPAGESTLGRLIADAQLAATQGTGAQIAFMNPGGIRGNLDAGDITYGEAFGVQPFSNVVTTRTYTGTQIEQILEQQFVTSSGGTRTLVLQVSAGFTYEWNPAGTPGDRVDPATIKLNNVTIDPAASYRVTANSFLIDGGDDFPTFKLGTSSVTGEDDLVALEAYLAANSPYTPITTPRITLTPG